MSMEFKAIFWHALENKKRRTIDLLKDTHISSLEYVGLDEQLLGKTMRLEQWRRSDVISDVNR